MIKNFLFALALLVTSSQASALSLTYERARLDRTVALEGAAEETISGSSDALSLLFTQSESSNDIFLGFAIKGIIERSEKGSFSSGLEMSTVTLESNVQKRNLVGLYYGAGVGISYMDYDFFGVSNIDYLGWTIGVAGAVPIITNKLFLSASIDYNILDTLEDSAKDSENGDLKGPKGEVGLAFSINEFAIKAGYKYRSLEGADDSILEFNDEVKGGFVAVTIRF